MFNINPRELQKQLRQLKRMGVKIDIERVEELHDVLKVSVELKDKVLVLENPTVTVMEIASQKVFYIIPAAVHEVAKGAVEVAPGPQGARVTDDDVKFVAEYTGLSLEEARDLLVEAGGDIVRALELAEQRARRRGA